MVDIRLGPNGVFDQAVPVSYNGLLYPLEGALHVDGTARQQLGVGQIGWLEPAADDSPTTIRFVAGEVGHA
jgi:hypothetical protein